MAIADRLTVVSQNRVAVAVEEVLPEHVATRDPAPIDDEERRTPGAPIVGS
jgi:hypothetical protein